MPRRPAGAVGCEKEVKGATGVDGFAARDASRGLSARDSSGGHPGQTCGENYRQLCTAEALLLAELPADGRVGVKCYIVQVSTEPR